jgi:Fe-S cluster biogenesis protein NfuA/nitrite reductase/ring-hydroxylating ferredoxin subunit
MSEPHTNNGGKSGDPIDGMNRNGRRIQEIVAQIDAMPNPAARALMQECMESVLGFYGDGIARMMELVKRSGIGGQKAYDDLLHDNVVRGLLLIHGLHPHDLATRLREALDKVRPYMESHGGNVELLSLENDFARLRLQGSCKTCPSSAVTLELAVRSAIEESCPDLAGFEVEGAIAAETARQSYSRAEWIEIENARQLPDGGFVTSHADELPLFICRVNDRHYAYRDRCPACNVPLHLGSLQSGMITCLEGHRFSVLDAGRSPDEPALHLDPFPLIEENGAIKVALASDSAAPKPEPATV